MNAIASLRRPGGGLSVPMARDDSRSKGVFSFLCMIGEIGAKLHVATFPDEGSHPIPKFGPALDLVAGRSLPKHPLQNVNPGGFAVSLADGPTDHLLGYNVDPGVLLEGIEETGQPANLSILRSRAFDSLDNLAILDAHFDFLGWSIAFARVNSTRLVTPVLLAMVDRSRPGVIGPRQAANVPRPRVD